MFFAVSMGWVPAAEETGVNSAAGLKGWLSKGD